MKYPLATITYILIIIIATLLMGCHRARGGELVPCLMPCAACVPAAPATPASTPRVILPAWPTLAGNEEESRDKNLQDENPDEHLMFGESKGVLAVCPW